MENRENMENKARESLEALYYEILPMREVVEISNALFEAAAMPSVKAMRTIIKALAYRLDSLGGTYRAVESIINEGLAEPEAVEGTPEDLEAM